MSKSISVGINLSRNKFLYCTQIFSSQEICQAINAMAAHDQNKEILADLGCIQNYVKALQSSTELKELQYIVKGLWVFSFLPKLKEQLKQSEGLTESEFYRYGCN